VLAHAGELGLLIVGHALDTALLPTPIGQPILGAIALSMLLAPLVAQLSDRLAALAARAPRPALADQQEASIRATSAGLSGHVVLAGCGPVGRLVAITLEARRVPYVAIERDVERLRRAQNDGHRAVFGDATRAGILKAAGIERAAAIVILVNNWHRSVRIIREARHLNPQIQVIASLRDDAHLGALVQAGASHIFPENYAAGLGLAAQALMSLGVEPGEAMATIQAIRAELSPGLQLLPA
jgi:CPA2 family monovalent cation:H+ antiporter-2